MLITDDKKLRYLKELDRRIYRLCLVLNGRRATSQDKFHGTSGKFYWGESILERSVIVDALDIQLAISDFETILKEIKKLK